MGWETLTAAQVGLTRSDRETDEPGSCRRGAFRHRTVDGSISIDLLVLSDNCWCPNCSVSCRPKQQQLIDPSSPHIHPHSSSRQFAKLTGIIGALTFDFLLRQGSQANCVRPDVLFGCGWRLQDIRTFFLGVGSWRRSIQRRQIEAVVGTCYEPASEGRSYRAVSIMYTHPPCSKERRSGNNLAANTAWEKKSINNDFFDWLLGTCQELRKMNLYSMISIGWQLTMLIGGARVL